MSGFEIAGLILSGLGIVVTPVVKALFDKFLSNAAEQNRSIEISISVEAFSISVEALFSSKEKAERKIDKLKYEEVKDELRLLHLQKAISNAEDMLDEIAIGFLNYRVTHQKATLDQVFNPLSLADCITKAGMNIQTIISNTFDDNGTSNHHDQQNSGGNGVFEEHWTRYRNLPIHLKKCFKLLLIYPQNHVFERDDLVHLWMALGFIQVKESETLEDIGRSYFAENLKSFFSSNGCSRHRYQLADVTIHELAKFASRGEWKRLDHQDGLRDSLLHLLSIECKLFWDTFDDLAVAFTKKKKKDTADHPAAADVRCEKLRTIIHIKINEGNNYPATDVSQPATAGKQQIGDFATRHSFLRLNSRRSSILPGFTSYSNELGLFKSLRVLDISCGCCIIQVPVSIGGLKHLRCLNLSNSKIVQLPKTICKLHCLLILKLNGCSQLKKLPGLAGLICLLHLCLDKKHYLESLPQGIEQLTNLETFSCPFVLGKKPEKNICVLKKMKNLRGSLCIANLENVSTFEEAREAALDAKPGLTELKLEWSKDAPKKYRFNEVLEGLKPAQGNLKKLKISGYGGQIFPHWVTSDSFEKLEKVSLSKCKGCNCLPPLWNLPNLKLLTISGIDQIELNIRDFFFGSGSSAPDGFSLLEILKFKDCSNLQKFNELQMFNCSLVIERCGKGLTDWMDQQKAWKKQKDFIYRRRTDLVWNLRTFYFSI
ncbi:disease resistance protein RGA2-like [Telopea speciosissima]|uniref:disease resistance protein RGA2-like n=1 Tax=Telopea speciosissima TaxID=54955 RepID=UPI001CC651A2|nr:disease resistance protein RGA2-like [Telopea speciosissima]